MQNLPFSQACENNKGPILDVLQRVFADRQQVLEIASGSGQHATWLAGHMQHLRWQPTEMPSGLHTLRPRCEQYEGKNLLPPMALNVSDRPWLMASPPVDALFTANSLHIMPWESVCDLFAELAGASSGTLLAVYGPFNYGGEYTSESNAGFDQWLSQQHPASAIRDFEKVDALARDAGFEVLEDNSMPANNRLLVWRSQ